MNVVPAPISTIASARPIDRSRADRLARSLPTRRLKRIDGRVVDRDDGDAIADLVTNQLGHGISSFVEDVRGFTRWTYVDRALLIRAWIARATTSPAFMEEHVYPNEATFRQRSPTGDRWQPTPIVEQLKAKARAEGLWNLFLPESEYGAGLTNAEYAPLCEIMGRAPRFAPEVFNCSAPDTGNMEVLVRYGTPEQKQQWLEPLLAGDDPLVLRDDRAGRRLLGRHQHPVEHRPRRRRLRHQRAQVVDFRRRRSALPRSRSSWARPIPTRRAAPAASMILVPMDTPGVTIKRMLPVFGYDDAPHGHAEIVFENVRVPAANMLLGEGRGFEIAQGRLGPGRIHHCMRLIGVAERALELMCARVKSRVAFGKPLAEQGTHPRATSPNRASRSIRRGC